MQKKNRFLTMVAAVGVGLSMGWLLPAYQAAQKNWKDRAEYDLYDAFTKAKDGKAKLDALAKWKSTYPDSEFKADREEAVLGVYQTDLKDVRRAFDQAKAMRATNPNNYYAIQTILGTVYNLPTPYAAPDLATAEETAKYTMDNADKVFAAANKPGNLQDAQWTQARPFILALAQRTYAWVFVQRKDDVRAEAELIKVVEAEANQPLFSYFLGSVQFNQRAKNLAKIPNAIFNIARASEYDGQGALPAAQRTQFRTSVTSIYKQYHGSDEGFAEVLAAARAGARPPAGFKIRSITEIEQEKFANQEAWDAEHPMQAFWRDTIKTPLMGENGDELFASTYKDAGLPPAGQAFAMFKAKIVSLTPEMNPTEIVVAVFDPNVPDAKLTFMDPLPGTMDVGSDIEFKGALKSFEKDPFMVTFDVDMGDKELVGWTGTGPAPKGKAKAKAPATKAGAKGKAKAK